MWLSCLGARSLGECDSPKERAPQFVANPKAHPGYSDEVRKLCLRMSVNDIGFRGMERGADIDHATVINCLNQVGD